ncbi:MAG: DNA mismatch repair protein MutS [Hyphomicrobiales bacterium]
MNDRPATDAMPDGAGDQRATPVMAQYLEIKAANPGSLLFYRMGDFYELFFEDAEIAARDLGIALTKRGKHQGNDIPMCGVPVHAAEAYLQRLIRNGHRVAVCEQLEDPAEARKRGSKSVVRRDVVRLVTPGTLTEDSLLDQRSHNYLAAVTRLRGSGDAALAWADISSGELAVQATAPGRLAADLARLGASEILVPDSLLGEAPYQAILDGIGAAVTPLPAVRFDSTAARQRLESHFDVAALDAFGNFAKAEVAALGGLLDYIALTQVGRMPHLRPPVRREPAGFLLIDAATRANLELTRTLAGDRRGSLLSVIDRTVTAGGARLLAERLAAPLADPVAIAARLDEIDLFRADAGLSESLHDALVVMPDIERALARLSLGRGGPRDLAAIRDGLACARTIAGALDARRGLADLPPNVAAAAATLGRADGDLEAELARALAADLPLLARDGGFVREAYLADLDANRALRDETRQVIAALQLRHAEDTGIKSLKVRHNNVLGYFIEVTAQNAAVLQAKPETYIHRQTVANAMRFVTTELAALEQKIAAAADRALAIELEVFATLVARVMARRDALGAIATAAAQLDVAASLAELAEINRYVRPRVEDSAAFELRGGRHPVVEAMLRERGDSAFVANDCHLSGEGRRLWLITGPNMAGKSTFLRQNALIVIMAQMGCFVPAAEALIGVVDRLFSRVGAADDLARGRSTFMVEMVETAAILNQATPRSFVILDEIGRGTATFDGLSIAWATIETLHDVTRCRALFATHYHELTVLSERLAELANATVKVREWQGDVIFLHEVVPGVADRSYGIQVARLAGLPPAVIARASEILERLERGGQTPAPRLAVEDLPLFSPRPAAAPPAAPAPSEIEKTLAALSPDELSPRQALALLYDLKAALADKTSR